MQPWKLFPLQQKSTLLSAAVAKKQRFLQLTPSEKNAEKKSEFWWLVPLCSEVFNFVASSSSPNKVTLIVAPDNNTANYFAQFFSSSSSSSSSPIIFALLLSVLRNKKITDDYIRKNQLRSEGKMEPEFTSLLRTVSATRGISSSSSTTSGIIFTTVEALSSRARSLVQEGSSASVISSGALSRLCEGCDLICLPGVERAFAEGCQSMTSQLVFLSTSAVEEKNQKITLPTPSAELSFAPHEELLPQGALAWFFDDEASTQLVCCNNVPGFLKRLRFLHDSDGENIENVLHAALLGAWCSSSTFAIHVRLAHIFRHLLDRSGSIDKETGEIIGDETATHLTLRVQASKAISLVASKAAPLAPYATDSSSSETTLVKSMVPRTSKNGPFLFRAVCSFAYGVAPHNTIDKLCAAWGVADTIIAGTAACKQAKRKQGAMIHAIRMRYATKHGAQEVGFLEFACHLLIDQVARMAAVTVGEVRAWLMWDAFFAPIYGKLTTFLKLINVLPSKNTTSTTTSSSSNLTALKVDDDDDKSNNKNNNKRSSSSKSNTTSRKQNLQQQQQKPNNFQYDEELLHPYDTPDDNKLLLLLPRFYKTSSLNTKQLPLHTAHERKEKMLHDSACEEILSAMPQKRIPMYIGDVGNLIGAWTKFNSKYEGRLGYTLTDFMLEHPEKFRVVSNVVMRVTESTHEPVRVRFDNNEWEGDDSDNDGNEFVNGVSRKVLNKKQKKEDEDIAKTGGKKKYTTRARNKSIKNARNKMRFDRNRKQLAQDARVPGYTKPAARKISGRGVKKNARNWKR